MGCGASSQAAVAGPHPSTTNSHHKGHQSGPEYQIDDWEGQNSGTRVEAAQDPRSPSHSHQSVTSTTSQSHHTTIAFGIVTNSIGSLVRNRIKGDVDAKAKPKDNENARQKTEKEIDEEREQVQATMNQAPVELDEKLKELFAKLTGNSSQLTKSNFTSKDKAEELDNASEEKKKILSDKLIELGIRRRTDDFIDDLFNIRGGKDEQLAFHEFKDKVKAELEITLLMASLSDSEILRNIAKALSFTDAPTSTENDDPMSRLRGLADDDFVSKVDKACEALKKTLDELRKEKKQDTQDAEQQDNKSSIKFEIDASLFVAEYGGLEDFKRGVRERIGAPHPKVWEEIMREHREMDDSLITFNPGNYDMETTSEEEYAIVTNPWKGREKSIGKRKVKSLEQLREVPLSKEAKLIKAELTAISLYTGPMFYKYNAVLRNFPKDALEKCKKNKYPTTITALLSGLRKLMWAAPLPRDRYVYRGLGGMNLPDTFFKQNEFGVRGGTEYGMMSTTRKLEVAIQYTGAAKKKKMPTVFKIGIGAINRGAVLDEFSQYPDESEVLFPPFSFLEVVGEITFMYMNKDIGVIRVVPLEVNANLTSPLLEDLIGMRKKLYIDSFEYQAQGLQRELQDLIERESMCSESEFCAFVSDDKKKEVVVEIVRQFHAVLTKHKGREPMWYNDDGKYRSAVIEMLSMKENAMAIPFLTMAMFQEWEAKQKALRQAQRMVFKDRKKALRVGACDDTKKGAALDLCKAHGIVAEQLEERNEMSETPLIKQAAEGYVIYTELLLAAGADVHAKMDNEIGFSAIAQAAYFGNAHCLQLLLDANADPRQLDNYGGTPLIAAAVNGELECIRLLLKAGDGILFEQDIEEDGKPVKKKLAYIDKGTKKNSTALMKACQNGHVACVRALIVEGADKELTSTFEVKDDDTKSNWENHANLIPFKFLPCSHCKEGELKRIIPNEYVYYCDFCKETDIPRVEAKAENLCRAEIGRIKKMNESSQKKIDYSEHKKCLQILKKTPAQIRAEDNDDKSISDSSRKESHIKSFESHLLGLHREIKKLIESNNNNKKLEEAWRVVKEAAAKEAAAKGAAAKEAAVKEAAEQQGGATGASQLVKEAAVTKETAGQQGGAAGAFQKLLNDRNEVPDLVVGHFKEVMEQHKRRTPKWYNDDSKYRWAVSEMLQLLDSAMAVPLLTPTMFEEWSGKLSGLRQASRMVRKEARRHLLDLKKGGAERQERALEICKQSGIVVEYLEELNEMQETPLIREAAEGGIRSVRLLLEAGADVHAKQQNTVGFRALNQAAYFGHPECIIDLVNWGADVNALDGHGGTPLVAAALNGEIECVRVLLAFKADVNKATKRGSTPLMKAAKFSHNKVARMLIVAGADKDLKDGEKRDGKTAREIAELELEKFKKIAGNINDKENSHEKSPDHIRAESCLQSLGKTPEQIRAEDWECQKTTDTGRKDSHIKTLNTLKIALKRELEELIKKEKPEFCCERELEEKDLKRGLVNNGPKKSGEAGAAKQKDVWLRYCTYWDEEEALDKLFTDLIANGRANKADHDAAKQQIANGLQISKDLYHNPATHETNCWPPKGAIVKDGKYKAQSPAEIVAKIAEEFDNMLESHCSRDAQWYNDDAKYSSAQNEMMNMHRNAKAVPFLTMDMYEEWTSKQSFLRQADRMANRDRTRKIRNEENRSKRKQVALDICKAVGLVMERLEERNEMSETPLIREAADGNPRHVNLLLEAGASIEAKQENMIGFTALNQAAYFGHKPVVKLLLRFGAEVDPRDGYGGTPLVAAALNGEFECLQLLIKGNANINHKTTNGNTPLMKAAINGHVNCVKWLLVQGALMDKVNTKNLTAKNQVEDKITETERKKKMAENILVDKQAAHEDGQSLHRTESKIEKEKAHDQSTIKLTLERYEHLLLNLKNVHRALDEGALLAKYNLLSIDKLRTLDLNYNSTKEDKKRKELDKINFQLQGSTSVSTVTISKGGSGYTSAPTVVFTAPPPPPVIQASATAVLKNGAVESITVTSGGSGYTSPPSVSFTGGGGSGAAAAAAFQVSTVTISAGGSGYTSAPTVVFTGGGGSGASATAVLTNDAVTSISTTSGGSGYTSTPTVSFTGGGGTGATASAALTVQVSTVKISAGGSGYTSAPTVVFTGPPLPPVIGASATAVVENGALTSITMTSGGSGYTSPPTVSFTGGGGTGAAASAALTVQVSTVIISAGGGGYTSAPTVVFTGGGAVELLLPLFLQMTQLHR